ncbi:MAG TPA: YoaK family protein [Pyrinomonadaceae bacterium]|nr:YoaK family protein [Pyrinomonadaceae bacterium]
MKIKKFELLMTPETRPNTTLLLLLHIATAITGLIDAISYLALGHVFTANMTGNVVFLAFAVAGTPGLSLMRSLTALVAFFMGAMIGGRVATRLSELVTPNWVTTALTMESALLLAATLVAINFRDSSGSPFQSYSIIVLTACAMGIRNATVRKMGIPDLTTTVLTLTITGLAADSGFAGGTSPRWRRRLLAVLLMFFGAAIGTLLLRRSLVFPLATATLLSICCVAISMKQRDVSEP